MSIYYFLYYRAIFLIFILGVISCQNFKNYSSNEVKQGPRIFELLSPVESGISFRNQLTEGLNTNVLMYEYFYNGGGVAIGDLNNDGLDDIYFTGNMVSNALYLNRGDLKFDDITDIAGVGGREGPWTTGVTMADVNGDGWLDIYVCYSGNLPPEKRKNQLFIHQGLDKNGMPIFEEKSEVFGLDIDSYSTQALFFDFDLDGDLDMFLLNHNPKSLPVLDESSTKDLLSRKDPSGSQLFRNDQGKFIEITEAAGIKNSALSYGLGVGAADLNGNGYLDIYVSNDYTATDYLYFNNGDGTFSELSQYALGHISQFSMGNELADFNNDGLIDIYTLDMLPEDNRRQKLLMSPDNFEKYQFIVNVGLHHQYMRNMLHLNNGNGRFSEIGQISGVSNTDWSWAALFADFDNDGWKDLFVSNGYRRDYTNLDFLRYMGDFIQNHRGNLKRENILELVSKIPASDISNYVFKNNREEGFINVTKDWGLFNPVNSNGAAYADLDNDGDLELIINNVDSPAFIYKNQTQETLPLNWLQIELKGDGENQFGIGARIYLYEGNNLQMQEQMPTRGYQSSVSYKIHFGLGSISEIDSLVIIWPGGKSETVKNIKSNSRLILDQRNSKNQELRNSEKTGKPIFRNSDSIGEIVHSSIFNDFKRQPLVPNPISGTKLAMANGDLNGDGLEDIVVGGFIGQSVQIFFQNRNGVFHNVTKEKSVDNSINFEDTAALIFDANGDGRMDIYIGSGGYGNLIPNDLRLQDRLYLNDGNGDFYRKEDALPIMLSPTNVVISSDFDNDGFPDLFIGSGVIPGHYPLSSNSYILKNKKDGFFEDVTSKYFPELKNFGIVKDAKWFDLNGDGQEELILVGEWMPISIYAFNGGRFVNVTSKYLEQEYRGWWNTVELEEVGGQKVLIVGNYGLNSQFKASIDEPLQLFFKDFDQNGSIDPILTSYVNGISYPFLTRDELLDHFTFLRSKFNSYESYADAKIDDIFSKDELKGAGHLKAYYLDTKMFVLGKDNFFQEVKLPIQVQYAPTHKVVFIDHFGEEYLLFLGNQEKSRLRIGKIDANFGVLISIKDLNNPKYIPQNKSGFNIAGESRNAVKIGKNKVVVNVLDSSLQVYEK
ncbi:VCBS repeat-containing protein [Cecembia calidifontis]|uniref:VCBS repeat protein n=1 Tax=Cecembia calidifontis TaxID=1187080 RepID=A0A4V2F651_9BACT|nr:VCBS repeat-containing protein [Cecembia calidifontis]RZS95099.1 VCBS repeat protein [Cecembia calidifontis]